MDYYRDGYGAAEVPTYVPEDLDRLFEETRPDALIVTSPDATHDVYIAAALERGLDVITEKPMTIDESRLRRIVDAVHASPRRPDGHLQLPLLPPQLRGPAADRRRRPSAR